MTMNKRRFHFRPLCFLVVALTVPGGGLFAQASFDAATEKAEDDLRQALEELSSTRDAIASEKTPLVRKVNRLEAEVGDKRDELERLRSRRDNRDAELERTDEKVDALKERNEYIEGLFDEFVSKFETEVPFSEIRLYGDVAEEARLALDDPDLNQEERFTRQLDVLDTAIGRLEKLTGGYTFEGRALAPAGSIEKGTFAAFGPSVYFSSEESPLAGITFDKVNTAEPAVAVPEERYQPGIRKFVTAGEGDIPADASGGKALQIERSGDTLTEHFAKGGSVGVVIGALGGVCLLLGIFKVFEVLRFTTPSAEKVWQVLGRIESGDHAGARTAANEVPGAGGDLLQAGVRHVGEKRGTLEEILYEKILAVRPRLERFLPFLALTAAAAPLLGLLGTVTGMIKTFNLITVFGTGDATRLSSGISEALVTTELGLIVAIPSLILHGLLARMARRKIGEMEQTAVGFINGVMGIRNKDARA